MKDIWVCHVHSISLNKGDEAHRNLLFLQLRAEGCECYQGNHYEWLNPMDLIRQVKHQAMDLIFPSEKSREKELWPNQTAQALKTSDVKWTGNITSRKSLFRLGILKLIMKYAGSYAQICFPAAPHLNPFRTKFAKWRAVKLHTPFSCTNGQQTPAVIKTQK